MTCDYYKKFSLELASVTFMNFLMLIVAIKL